MQMFSSQLYGVDTKLVLKTEEKLVIYIVCFENIGKVMIDSAELDEKVLIKC